jgi:hypothetical protein
MVSSCIKNGQKQRPSCGHSPTVNDGFCPGDGNRPLLTRQARPSHQSAPTDMKTLGVADYLLNGANWSLIEKGCGRQVTEKYGRPVRTRTADLYRVNNVRFYNNLEDRGDCQSTRKSHKTSYTVGWSVG